MVFATCFNGRAFYYYYIGFNRGVGLFVTIVFMRSVWQGETKVPNVVGEITASKMIKFNK